MSRPYTLAQAVERIRHGEPYTRAIPEFLDSFYTARDNHVRVEMFAEAPPLTGCEQLDALMGAICEYLSKRYQLGSVPRWASDPCRSLSEPWFTLAGADDGMKEFLTFSSPAEFAHRNIFTESEPLRRASQMVSARQKAFRANPTDP